jgi:hypothetical protein
MRSWPSGGYKAKKYPHSAQEYFYNTMTNEASTRCRKLTCGEYFFFIKSRRIRRGRQGAWLE